MARKLSEAAAEALAATDWTNIDAMTEANIARQIASNPDAEPDMAPEFDVRAVRRETGLAQAEFAAAYHFSVRTVQEWERGAKRPSGPARTLLRAIKADPEGLRRALAAGRGPGGKIAGGDAQSLFLGHGSIPQRSFVFNSHVIRRQAAPIGSTRPGRLASAILAALHKSEAPSRERRASPRPARGARGARSLRRRRRMPREGAFRLGRAHLCAGLRSRRRFSTRDLSLNAI